MSLKEHVYSVLIVSATENFNAAITPLLPESTYYPVHFVSSISAAKRATADRAFDFVIINSPLPDDSGTRFAVDVCTTKEAVVLLLVKKRYPCRDLRRGGRARCVHTAETDGKSHTPTGFQLDDQRPRTSAPLWPKESLH